MPYVPNWADVTIPLNTEKANTAAEDFRAGKIYIRDFVARFANANVFTENQSVTKSAAAFVGHQVTNANVGAAASAEYRALGDLVDVRLRALSIAGGAVAGVWVQSNHALQLGTNNVLRVTVNADGSIAVVSAAMTLAGAQVATQAWATGQFSLLGHNHDASYSALAHGHAAADITSGVIATARLGGAGATVAKYLRGDQNWSQVDWTELTGKPGTFTPSAHTHGGGDITSTVGTATTAGSVTNTNSNGYGVRTISTADPSGVPADGDIWIKREA